jgi:adenylyltransferase/sulfurtransferase
MNKKDEERYSRQIKLPVIGEEGQEKIGKAKIVIIGIGALGTNTSQLLARAGIGALGLIDYDKVELSNLQRQSLFSEEDIGLNKAEAAKRRLSKINSMIKIKSKIMKVSTENIEKIKEIREADLILDCTDNLKTRMIINDFCLRERKKWIYAACVKTEGYVMLIEPGKGPCLECFLKERKLDTAATAGIINTIPTMVGAMQSTLALKEILEKRGSEGELTYINIWEPKIRRLKVKINQNCKCNRDK